MLAKLAKAPQFLRFALIGGVNTGVHAAILALLVELFRVPVVIANLVAFMLSNIFSYLMNSTLTFHVKPTFGAYLKFLSASLLALGLTLLISGIMAHLGFHYLQGFLVVIVVVPAVSFLAVKLWVFSSHEN